MQPLPHLETCLRLAYEARDATHPSGVALASYFARAPTRGRKRTEPDEALLFPEALRARAGAGVARALDPATYRTCAAPRPTDPVATREWLAEAALAVGKGESFPLMWALLRAMSELESAAQKLLGPRTPRAVVRQVLHGVGARGLRAEPFAALLVRVLKIAQAVYVALRHAGEPHDAAWEGVQDRLWSPHPTGERAPSGAEERGAYLPSLVQAASANARRKLKKSAEEGRTRDHAQALLARFAAGPGRALWPWADEGGRLVPVEPLEPGVAALAFFVLLTHAASERRGRGGPSGGLSQPFEEAGFAASEWLPDRTDDLAVRLLGATGEAPRGDLLEALHALLRATLSTAQDAGRSALEHPAVDLSRAELAPMLERARQRLPELLRWLEENGRELLETT